MNIDRTISSIIVRAIGIFLLPFGTVLSISYLLYAIPMRKKPIDFHSKPLNMVIEGEEK